MEDQFPDEVAYLIQQALDAARAAAPDAGLREALETWVETRLGVHEWHGPPEWTAEQAYDAAVEEVQAIIGGQNVVPGFPYASPAAPAGLDAAYRERNALVAALIRTNGWPAQIVMAPDTEGWWIVYAETPEGQVSWHVSPDDMDLFSDWPVAFGSHHSPWDGHTTDEKYTRLARLRAAAPAGLDVPDPAMQGLSPRLVERAVMGYVMRAGWARTEIGAQPIAADLILTVRYPHLRWDLDFDHETDEHRSLRAAARPPEEGPAE
jgi:hypothetical protein